jgi:hypothetical protein
MQHERDRRHLLSALMLAPFAGVWRASPVAPQSGAGLPPLQQPNEPTKAALLARARACSTKPSASATRPMGRWWCATASSSGRAGTTSCCRPTPPRTPNCWRCATRRAGSAPATGRSARSIPPQLPAPRVRARSTGRVCVGCSPRARWSMASCRSLDVERLQPAGSRIPSYGCAREAQP